jgi:glycosyltransferase involved in cell wall biosynthesis
MKVGFLGNVNNYPYVLARYFREFGHEVLFFVTAPPEDRLHRPEHFVLAESYPYPDWIHEAPFPKPISFALAFPKLYFKSYIDALNTCDAVVLNDFGHSIKPLLRKNIPSVSVFSGSDLDVNANLDMLEHQVEASGGSAWQKPIKRFLLKKYMMRQREGIRQASMISYFPTGIIPTADAVIQDILKDRTIPRYPHCHIPIEGIEYVPYPDNSVPILFNLTRFLWKEPLPPGFGAWENKRNDIMLKGVANWCTKHQRVVQLHLVEKGIHIAETKELIQQLGIADMITWHTEMSHKDIFSFYAKSDIVFEQMGSHILTGGLYPMLIGRPVIGNGRPEIFRPIHGEDSPVCQAKSPEEVSEWLEILLSDKSLREERGRKSREFVIRHFNIKDEALAFAETLENAVKISAQYVS